MIGIYKIENKISKKCYIGLSINIEKRIKDHFSKAFIKDKEYNKSLYRAIRKYGKENFNSTILEECLQEELFEKEIYYINKYNSYYNGYNETLGGEGVITNSGEKHSRHKLTEKEVIDIRKRYNNKERNSEVYEIYKDKIGRSGFQKIWNGYTWKNVMFEVYTKENKEFHRQNTGSKGSANHKSKVNEQDVLDIRQRRNLGEDKNEVFEDYKIYIKRPGFNQIWNNTTWKNIEPVSTISVVGE